MHVNCRNCLHLKKLPGEMLVFCKMNRLPQFCEISESDLRENGVIELDRRELFRFAEVCPIFVNMED